MNIPRSYNEARTILNDKSERNLRGKRSTRLIVDGNDIHLRYHSTNVVTFHNDGSMTLRNGGWQSKTTKERINEVLGGYGRVFQRDWNWYLSLRDCREISFENGMKIRKLSAFA